MLDFLRRTKDGITPTLDEVELLIEQIDRLKGNLIDLRVAITNNSPKAKNQIPNLLIAIQGNLERDLRLVIETKARTEEFNNPTKEPSKSNYNQDFSEEDKADIMAFCKNILRDLDKAFLSVIQDRDAGNQLENKKYIIRETIFRFNIYEYEIMWLQNHLKKRETISKTADIVEDIKNLCLTLINHMLYASLEERINETKF